MEKIQVGDTVNVNFVCGDSLFECEVLHIPSATGDCWHLKTKDEKLFYVQLFETLELKRRNRP